MDNADFLLRLAVLTERLWSKTEYLYQGIYILLMLVMISLRFIDGLNLLE